MTVSGEAERLRVVVGWTAGSVQLRPPSATERTNRRAGGVLAEVGNSPGAGALLVATRTSVPVTRRSTVS